MQLQPLHPIGAEVRGVDVRSVDAPEFEQLREALLDYGVLVVRDQSLTPGEQVALGRRFGELEGQGFREDAPHPDVIVLSNVTPEGAIASSDSRQMKIVEINEQWHTDSSFREIPATISIFHGVVLPPVGGDTLYASLQQGWLELDRETQDELIGLRAVHDYNQAYQRIGAEAAGGLGIRLPPMAHPMARVHPETGRHGLYVSGHAFSVEGRPAAQGRALIGKLIAWCTREACVYRHRWREGDLLMWDNRSMLHQAERFDEAQARVMHHVRVAGSTPVIAHRSDVRSGPAAD